jgi:hypothetical protein
VSDLKGGGDSLPLPAPLGIDQIEEQIQRADEELGKLTQTHIQLCDEMANAKADWENHRDRVITLIAASGDKSAKDTREALAKQRRCGNPRCPCGSGEVNGEDLFRRNEVTRASSESSARAMKALEARLNALQTQAANVRAAFR